MILEMRTYDIVIHVAMYEGGLNLIKDLGLLAK
jgi:hypothetical protein